MKRKEIGIAVVGSGRIGILRAFLAAKNPSVVFLAVSDLDPDRARALVKLTGADFHSRDNNEVISRPEVTVVIVFSPSKGKCGVALKAGPSPALQLSTICRFSCGEC